MKAIVPIKTSALSTVYVEVYDTDEPAPSVSDRNAKILDQPPGSELTSPATQVIDSMAAIHNGLGALIADVSTALRASNPNKWKLEISLGFKGKTSPTPVVLSGEANAALKLHLEWTRTAEHGDS